MCEYVIAYDVGTTGIKTCLFSIGEEVKLVESSIKGYELYVMENGGVEQDPKEWWQSMCDTTTDVIKKSGVEKESIKGISFCAQMQGVVLVDEEGEPVRRAMSYMDNRAEREYLEGMVHGFKVSGMNFMKLITSLRITGAVPASVKDPLWKYKWVQNNEPHVFKKVYKWLDVKEYLISKAAGKFVMTEDSAFATMIYDSRKNGKCFSKKMCRIFDIDMNHLPNVVKSTQCIGTITSNAASELGLSEETKVFGGGGDASLIGVGSGAVKNGDTHIYMGTSGWVSTVTEKRVVDLGSMIASIVGAAEDKFNYFAELETAGKCLEWVKDHLALDEIGIYLHKQPVSESKEVVNTSLYDYMMHVIKDVEPGSGGVIFTPWLHGNRCPFEDHNARGMFFNIGLETGKTEMIHSVVEGVCYHLRWQLEASLKKVKSSGRIRLVGGGALAPLTCQILADITGKPIETVENPQNVGAVGAAVTVAVGLGIIPGILSADKLIKARKTYYPRKEKTEKYERYYNVFTNLYKNNKKAFNDLNGTRDEVRLRKLREEKDLSI